MSQEVKLGSLLEWQNSAGGYIFICVYVCVGMCTCVGVVQCSIEPRVANIAGKDFTLSPVLRIKGLKMQVFILNKKTNETQRIRGKAETEHVQHPSAPELSETLKSPVIPSLAKNCLGLRPALGKEQRIQGHTGYRARPASEVHLPSERMETGKA